MLDYWSNHFDESLLNSVSLIHSHWLNYYLFVAFLFETSFQKLYQHYFNLHLWNCIMITHVVIYFRTIQSMLINVPIFSTRFNERLVQLEIYFDFVAYVIENIYDKAFWWSWTYLRSKRNLTGRFYLVFFRFGNTGITDYWSSFSRVSVNIW